MIDPRLKKKRAKIESGFSIRAPGIKAPLKKPGSVNPATMLREARSTARRTKEEIKDLDGNNIPRYTTNKPINKNIFQVINQALKRGKKNMKRNPK